MTEDGVATRNKPRLRRRVLRCVVALMVVYAIWLLIGWTLQERVLFPGATAWNAITRPASTPGPEWERWTLDRDDGTTGLAWFRLAQTDEVRAPVAVYFHGNGDIAPNRTDMGDVYDAMGVHTLLVEYPGYDDAQGTPGQEAIIADALLALERVLEREEVDPDRLILHGHSLGGGVAAQIADRREPRVLILESTFTSMNAMVKRYAVPTFLLRHPFRTDEVLGRLDVPVLVLHGDLDVIIYPSHAERNAQIARDATLVRFPTYGHDGCYLAPNYRQVLRDFLREKGVLTPR